MLSINKISLYHVIDFAAEELKKYLRMMNPNGGDIKITYCQTATDGYNLALMQDVGLDVSDAENTELDDIIYIDTNGSGGIIAACGIRIFASERLSLAFPRSRRRIHSYEKNHRRQIPPQAVNEIPRTVY